MIRKMPFQGLYAQGLHLRLLARVATMMVACCCLATGFTFGQSGPTIDSPIFRPRTDAMATRDADAVRERLKSLSDSRGLINPLGDYVKPKKMMEQEKTTSKDREPIDEEAQRIPSFDTQTLQRLKARPPSVAANERHFIDLYPPPQIMSNTSGWIVNSWQDDGFRPTVVRANYQLGDPESMLPPTLGAPSPNVQPYSTPPSSLPPSGSLGGMPGGVPFVGAPGSNVIVAPPSYIVPGPSNPAAVPMSGMPMPGAPMPGAPMTGMPYATSTPTYSRPGGTVNSLPFVSPPPQARDARWMVSPEVYRRMEGAQCATPSPPAYGAPAAGAGMGSPFFYAPPTAMPMPTPRTASRHSWLHPFRH